MAKLAVEDTSWVGAELAEYVAIFFLSFFFFTLFFIPKPD